MRIIKQVEDDFEEVFCCQCGGLDHSMRMSYFDPMEGEEDVIYVEFYLSNWRSFWKRLGIALTDLRGKEPEYGLYQTMTFRNRDMDRLQGFLSRMTDGRSSLDKPLTLSIHSDDYELRFVHECWEVDEDICPELHVKVFFKRGASLLRRAWRSLRYVVGKSRHFNKTDCFDLYPDEATVLTSLIHHQNDLLNS